MKNTFVYNNHLEAKKVLSTLESELEMCDEFIFSVAFISESGLTSLLQTLKNLEEKNIRGKILTTNYLYFNTPKVLEKLSNFKNISLKIYDCVENKHGFHTKGYLFRYGDSWKVLMGSSNLTSAALTINKEWNTFIEGDRILADNILDEFNSLWEKSKSYSEIKDKYVEEFASNQIETVTKKIISEEIKPNKMQRSFIENFEKLRNQDNKGLLISATGTGKTFAAAFAMKSIVAKRLLFIVHREQIARQALETFKTIFGTSRSYGLLTGKEKNIEADFIFSTVQTMSKEDIFKSFNDSHFDEIIIDEVHRAGADSYLRLMDYFKPTFYLGMTASPDRTDSFNIYELFNNNIVYEVRLKEAMENSLLCPFHYFGISDLEVDGKVIDELSEFSNLVSNERVEHIISKINYYGYSGDRVKGLVFCSSKQEAKVLSEEFNTRGYNTTSLTGEDSQERREQEISKLVANDGDMLDYIFTVDIFNEGVDIPEVNQVIMLRPTQSSIIFIQQLGRGLRKSANKEFVVIIDFIANYKNNFLIPVALSGDNSYDKDTVRKFLSQGTRYIPGMSTIHFDEISKQRIYSAIDNVKLNTWLFVTDEYNKLKNKLGRIPTYSDFENYDAIDVRKIFEVAGSYYLFLTKKEKHFKYGGKLLKTAENMLNFVSTNLILSKKIEELIILDLLLDDKKRNILKAFEEIMLRDYNKFIADYELDVSRKILTNNFVTSSVTKKKFHDCIFLDENVAEIRMSKEFEEQLQSEIFRELLQDLVDYGIYRYNKNYKDNYTKILILYYMRNIVSKIFVNYSHGELTMCHSL